MSAAEFAGCAPTTLEVLLYVVAGTVTKLLRTHVLLIFIKRTCARWSRRLISQLCGRRGDPVSVAASEVASTKCFGPLGEREHLALEGFVHGHRPPRASSDHDPLDWLG
jgi:hypothetical protein